MKALIAEYATHHDPALAPEGKAMFSALAGSFTRCGYEVLSPSPGKDFEDEIGRLADLCDIGLVIAPDHLLPRFTLAMETRTHNLGCGSMNAAVCADKLRTGVILSSHGIAVPPEVSDGLRVVKPVNGCGSQGVRLTEGPAGRGEFGQAFIEGEHYSVSVLGSRVVGEACLYFSGEPPKVLSLNRQAIERGADGIFHYRGGETPAPHPRAGEICRVATDAVNVLGCQGYTGVDVVVSDRIYVLDVNPRITTSIAGICACMEEEIAHLLVRASKGEPIGAVHFSCSARFDSHGRILEKKGIADPSDHGKKDKKP